MKILVLCDDFYHHGEIVKDGLSFLSNECEMTFAETPAELSGFDAIVIAKDNMISKTNKEGWFTGEIEKQFAEYVNNGGGLLFLHAGSVLCKRSASLKSIAGCEFAQHPEQCVVDYKITSPEIFKDSDDKPKDFSEKDEHYFIDFVATDAEVFLESSSSHGVQPAGYLRPQGKGRVCVLTPGHNLAVFQNKEYQKIIKYALYWCAKGKA